MHWLVRTRLLLWIAVLATVPAAILDLTGASWSVLTVPAGLLGFSYYAAQTVIGFHRAGSQPLTVVILSIVLVALPFVLVHYFLVRRSKLNASRVAPAA